jgi:FMN phosphatase YigB (HAD superfamily)
MQPTGRTPMKGIIFDLDGTLYRMEWFFQPMMFLGLLPHSLRLLRLLSERSKLAGIDFGTREVLLSTLCENLSRYDAADSRTLRTWIADRFYPAFISTMRFQRSGRPQLLSLLSHLKNRGIKLAVLSDYHAVEERLRTLRIPVDFFDLVTSCEYSGALKPSPRPFTEIARQWQIAATEVLVVGDRSDTDGIAARNAGMQFLRIIDKKKETASTSTALTWPALRTVLLNY